ncbi:MAG: SLC13 family permease [Gammaproteobacteria bacterium]
MYEAYILLAILAITLILFIWGYWRYDVVACIALISLVALGIVQTRDAFNGLSNPAVITVACVMIITQAITQSGIIDHVVKRLTPITSPIILHIGILTIITAVLSAFMNNVGALALMMPVAIKTAIDNDRSPSLVLMPIAFASVLGGLTTAIGTPPNLLISSYRLQVTGHPYTMFDFTPVGFWIALAAVIFIALVGWRLIPKNRKAPTQDDTLFHIKDYTSEIIVPSDSPIVGKTCQDLEVLTAGDFSILSLIRNKQQRLNVNKNEILQAEDILIIEASHDDLHKLLDAGKLELASGDMITPESFRGGDISLIEAVVPQNARVEGRSWAKMRIRSRLRVNLLAIARQGRAFKKRLNHVHLHAGDVILLQGETETLRENTVNLGLLPLAERNIKVGFRRKALLPIAIFIGAIILAALQIFQVQIAFSIAVLALVLTKAIPMRKIYASIDWPIIILLAAMIPIGGAFQATGGTAMIADFVVNFAGHHTPLLIIALLLIVTMTLSDIMNNAATAVVMAPIAMSIAQSLNVSIDPFLMAVAIGASCSFLTPISHQNNTLVMGPGGYKFYDYIRLGLPTEIIVIVVALPLILKVWPI